MELRSKEAFFINKQQYVYTYVYEKPCVKVGDFIRIGDLITPSTYMYSTGLVMQLMQTPNSWVICFREVRTYGVSRGASLYVSNADIVTTGDILFDFLYEHEKTGDIVQGLPKIEQLFEARQKRNKNYILFTPKNVAFTWFLSGRRIGLSYPNATVLGLTAAQLFLLNTIQRAYKTQGVNLSDKHMEIIVRRMCSYVLILDARNTPFLQNEIVDHDFLVYCNTVQQKPAFYVPVIFGITKLGLQNGSFLSAASFQHTRTMLMNAALESKPDHLRDIKQCNMLGELLPLGPMNRQVLQTYFYNGFRMTLFANSHS